MATVVNNLFIRFIYYRFEVTIWCVSCTRCIGAIHRYFMFMCVRIGVRMCAPEFWISFKYVKLLSVRRC